jgi:tetratricopeptide (TPR) repeat protein
MYLLKRVAVWLLILGTVIVTSAVVAGQLAAEHNARRAVLSLTEQPAPIIIDYPAEGSIFPPDMTAPTFLWRDSAEGVTLWLIDVAFADGSAPVQVKPRAERMRIGEIDPQCVAKTNELPKLTPQQAEARTWMPDVVTWTAIKKHSVGSPATLTITGFEGNSPDKAVSRGRILIQTSKDPVGAPIFYRDVPLMPSKLKKGVIKPLAPNALPLIAWRLRSVSEPRSRRLLGGLHTCANCHSFSRDGKTLGMDLDGPANDKGLYAIVPVKPQMSIRNEDVVAWSSFRGKLGDQLRVGFMSQVSPDGQYVVTTIKPAATAAEAASRGISEAQLQRLPLYYVANFNDYRFLQVFYPTRGILVWYSRETGRLQPLPGADDRRYVHTNAVWSPDGKYLVFARAEAEDPYPPGGKLAHYANDPNETPIQYDLYRIPFNEGKGGRPEPIAGASRNGMSNSFPKISPDGRWIVFVQSRNGLLMRPDGQLYIVPAEGGQARKMRCNTPLMNSWHSFSPNGRWLVFSSKSRSPYTQMFLTHLDEAGRDSPAILIENATAANRAVNIPEFVNIPPDGLLKIDAPATEFYRLVDVASDLAAKGQYEAAIVEWKKALGLNPEDDRAQNNLGVALAATGRLGEAIPHFEKALAFNPESDEAHTSFGAALAGTGKIDVAIPHYRKALEINPENSEAHSSLGAAMAQKGRLDEAIPHFEKALELKPDYLEACTNLGAALVQKGKFGQAIVYFEKALKLKPGSAELHNSLGFVLLWQAKTDQAIAQFNKAIEISPTFVNAHDNLGSAFYYLKGNTPEALVHWRQVLRLEPNHVPVLTQTAWVLATSPEGSVRNGTEAVQLAERAVQLSGAGEPAILDSLAAAYAEVGRFSAAVQTASRALALAKQMNNQELAEALNARIVLYQAKIPFREKQGKR